MKILGCDDKSDAIQTLASIYQVETKYIIDIANGNWPNFLLPIIGTYKDNFEEGYLPSLMASHLKTTPNWDFGEVAYYHRTAYDGSENWFQEGLLPSEPAAYAFFEKVKPYLEFDEQDISLSIANIKNRNSFEGAGSGGPYAFDIFENAKHANVCGMNYSLPEFMMGDVWLAKYDVAHACSLREALRKKLKTVVVKFLAQPTDPDLYISNIWQYLYRAWNEEPMGKDSHYPCTFLGCGKLIPSNKIIKIIDL